MQQHPQHLYGLRCRERIVANPLGSQELEGDWNALSLPTRLSPLLKTGFHRKSAVPGGTPSAALRCILIKHSSNMPPPQARGPTPVLQLRAGVSQVPNYGIGPGLETVVLDRLFWVSVSLMQNKCTYSVMPLRVILKFNEIIYLHAHKNLPRYQG